MSERDRVRAKEARYFGEAGRVNKARVPLVLSRNLATYPCVCGGGPPGVSSVLPSVRPSACVVFVYVPPSVSFFLSVFFVVVSVFFSLFIYTFHLFMSVLLTVYIFCHFSVYLSLCTIVCLLVSLSLLGLLSLCLRFCLSIPLF